MCDARRNHSQNNIWRHYLRASKIEDVLTKLQAFPTQLQSECIWLSPGFLFYEECEQACASDQPYNECLRMCESGDSPSGWSCHNGCRSLSAALKERSGDCPPEIWPTIHRIPGLSKRAQSIGWIGGNKNSPNEIALEGEDMLGRHFSTRCSEDLECVRDREKCCQSRCREAIYRDDILPPAPTVQVLEANNPPSFILSWGQRDLGNNLSEPTVYVLQVKSYFGPDYDSQHAGAWRTLVMTTLMDAQLKEPLVGWWYQFQLTAVNRFGSRGFEFLSPPVQLSNQKPKPPSPPVNLTCNYMALQMNGTIAAEFQWVPPTQTSIPVTEYIVHLCLNATGACSDVPNVPKKCNKCNKIRPSVSCTVVI
ncbi:unnamed protein product [Dicrocoelium dendriticum]|nr:unnamed protein product [Dicrocoelium dendriticum]